MLNADLATAEVDVLDPNASEFTGTNTAACDEFEDVGVPFALRIGDLGSAVRVSGGPDLRDDVDDLLRFEVDHLGWGVLGPMLWRDRRRQAGDLERAVEKGKILLAERVRVTSAFLRFSNEPGDLL